MALHIALKLRDIDEPPISPPQRVELSIPPLTLFFGRGPTQIEDKYGQRAAALLLFRTCLSPGERALEIRAQLRGDIHP